MNSKKSYVIVSLLIYSSTAHADGIGSDSHLETINLVEYSFSALTIVALAFLIFFTHWHFFGRDKKDFLIVPEFSPPNRLSPAAMRYIYKEQYDSKCLAVTFINSIVNKCYKITERNDEFFVEYNSDNHSALSEDEKRVLQLIENRDQVAFDGSNRDTLLTLHQLQEKELSEQYANAFSEDRSFTYLYLLIIVATASWLISVWVILAFLAGLLLYGVIKNYAGKIKLLIQKSLSLRYKDKIKEKHIIWIVVSLLGIVIPVLSIKNPSEDLGSAIFLGLLLNPVFLIPSLMAAAVFAIAEAFHSTNKKYTKEGKALIQKIEGFRHFLNATESERVKMVGCPGHVPELYEKYIAYSMALDVEKKWSGNFSRIIEGTAF